MLTHLSVNNIVLIDHLDLEFRDGLSVLTGETGAGKSILLDALGLVLGARAEQGLLRAGCASGSVTGVFDCAGIRALDSVLAEHGIELEDGQLMLRRIIRDDGRSRAFINDEPVSIGLLREIGDRLVEIHGQHGQQGLLNSNTHRALLDTHAGLGQLREGLAQKYEAMASLQAQVAESQAAILKARGDEDYLRHAVDELTKLAPQPQEEDQLASKRAMMMHGEQVASEVADALNEMTADTGAEASVRNALRRLERVADKAGGGLDATLEALARAFNEVAEAVEALETSARHLEFDQEQLETTEERLFALRAAARKHNCQVDDLPSVLAKLESELYALDTGEHELEMLHKELAAATTAYEDAAKEMSRKRVAAAAQLDTAINVELPPLKLEKATFHASVKSLPREQWGAFGADQVIFEVSTNPGSPMGPLSKIASGGELSRFALAIKVVLAKNTMVPTMVFDEIDQGIGGAVAAAVGERLARLASDAQILVVTHSPQVAARGAVHLQVGKKSEGASTLTQVNSLSNRERREEIARMLAGAQITEEARAAAERLLEGIDQP